MTNTIGALFGRSPIKPIQDHMAKAQECVVVLGEFLEASFKADWSTAEGLHKTISVAEHEADEIKRDIRVHLPKSLLLPVARTDLLELLSTQDRIADRAKELASLMLTRKMVTPDAMIEIMRQHYRNALNTATQAHKAIEELDELLETSFRGRAAKVVEGLIKDLEKLEAKSDVSKYEIKQYLFDLEATLPPVNVMFLYKAIDLVEEIANLSNKLGGRLLLLVAR